MNMMDIIAAASQPKTQGSTPYPQTPGATPGPIYGPGNPPGLGAIYNPLAYGTRPQLPATTTNTTSQTGGWQTGLYNYPGLNQQAAGLAGSLMGGNVSQGTLNLLGQQSAERNVGFGSGSPLTSAQFLAATGQLSENLALQGGQLYNSLLQNTPRTTSSSGTQTTDLSAEQALLNAAPDPYAAAMANWAAMNAGLGIGGQSTTFARPGGGYFPGMPQSPAATQGQNPYTGGAFSQPAPTDTSGGGGYAPYDWTGGGGATGGMDQSLQGGMVDPWATDPGSVDMSGSLPSDWAGTMNPYMPITGGDVPNFSSDNPYFGGGM